MGGQPRRAPRPQSASPPVAADHLRMPNESLIGQSPASPTAGIPERQQWRLSIESCRPIAGGGDSPLPGSPIANRPRRWSGRPYRSIGTCERSIKDGTCDNERPLHALHAWVPVGERSHGCAPRRGVFVHNPSIRRDGYSVVDNRLLGVQLILRAVVFKVAAISVPHAEGKSQIE
jgi:hypothetical protein